MTYEETLYILENLQNFYALNSQLYTEELVQAIDYAKIAVKKQIKQQTIEDGYYSIPCCCPNCGTDVVGSGNYCWSCGQAIKFPKKRDN